MDKELDWDSIMAQADADDEGVDLARAAFLIAQIEYPGLDIEHELSLLDSLAAGAAHRLGENRDTIYTLNTISEYLFDEVELQGNTDEYYDPRNSYLNQVLKRRLGIPITLSLVYLEVGKRLGIPLVGIGMPGHFLLRHRDEKGLFVDPFNRGILLSEEECAERLTQVTQSPVDWDPEFLNPISNREYLTRILRNLKSIYLQQGNYERALSLIDRLVQIQPQLATELRDRGLVKHRLGFKQGAANDIAAYLKTAPPGTNSEQLRQLLDDIGMSDET
ncbi:MAG: hypothetical protein BZY75_03075 [SAR202 cluster bacterium Io17-Chloro-G7]|nr:MAG: hypothetical protein BZY75_03075 [SAR202 cluster bacterium Io17-Chloro-G7]